MSKFTILMTLGFNLVSRSAAHEQNAGDDAVGKTRRGAYEATRNDHHHTTHDFRCYDKGLFCLTTSINISMNIYLDDGTGRRHRKWESEISRYAYSDFFRPVHPL